MGIDDARVPHRSPRGGDRLGVVAGGDGGDIAFQAGLLALELVDVRAGGVVLTLHEADLGLQVNL